MKWKNQRRLVYLVSGNWAGWFCERCGWNLPQFGGGDQDLIALHVQADFEVHDCELFARQHWKKTPQSSQTSTSLKERHI